MTTASRQWLFWVSLAGVAAPWSGRAQSVINLESAANYGVLGSTTVTSVGATIVNGNLGLSPGTAVSGFVGVAPGGLGVVTGVIDIADSAAAQAASDLSSAFSMAAGLSPTSPGNTVLNDATLTPGVYNSGTLALSGTITLDGEGQTDPLFVFQIGSTLNSAAGTQIILINGATAADIYWLAGSSATLGSASTLDGNFLALTSITVDTGSTFDGRLLSVDGPVTLNDDLITAVPEPADTAWVIAACVGFFAGLKLRGGTRCPQRVERRRLWTDAKRVGGNALHLAQS